MFYCLYDDLYRRRVERAGVYNASPSGESGSAAKL